MDIEDVRCFALTLTSATEDMPYGPDWLIFRIGGKIFLHIWLESPKPTCAVKLQPDYGAQLREHHDGIRPAYHLNKMHWNDLYLNMLTDSEVKNLIETSYKLVRSKLPKKIRESIV